MKIRRLLSVLCLLSRAFAQQVFAQQAPFRVGVDPTQDGAEVVTWSQTGSTRGCSVAWDR
ncbi:MAG: hypothetical protein JWO91_114 [Acidobacteriaceae bacterium]|jgi:hypothetical protein|nr:hypothetical protein [Acidobacteriaceae bacterium]